MTLRVHAATNPPSTPGSRLRVGMWGLHLALPLLGLWLLLAYPHLDVAWQHNLSHFLVVVAAAVTSFVIALTIRREARRRADARLLLIALAFLTASAFLFLHGLATPQVLLARRTSGFVDAAAVGLVVAGVFAVLSSLPLPKAHADAVVRWERGLLGLVLLAVGTWSVVSLLSTADAGRTLETEAGGLLAPLAVAGVPLYVAAIWRYWRLYRRRPAVMLISVITAFALLAEALVVVSLSRAWQLSWWEWHVLLLLGFAFVGYSAHVQYRREGSARSLFAGVSLEETVRRIRDEHRAALGELVDSIQRGTGSETVPVGALAARVGERFGLTEAQVAVLVGAAEAHVEVDDLRRQLDGLFHLYLSPDVADALLSDPGRAELGGATTEVTVLFADLRGFTPYSESTDPGEVVMLLNRYFQVAVPIVLRHGGTVVSFIGDALMALFNAPKPLPDHALHAARAAIALQRRTGDVAADHPEWPRFRVGVNTGPALVGNVGGEVRSFTAIGDATNLAARLQTVADPGQVVIGATTRAALAERATVEAIGPLAIKGKAEPVAAYVLTGVATEPARSTPGEGPWPGR